MFDDLACLRRAVSCSVKSPTFLPQLGDACVLPVMDLRIGMGMFQQGLSQPSVRSTITLAPNTLCISFRSGLLATNPDDGWATFPGLRESQKATLTKRRRIGNPLSGRG